jgi:hypothetical protein
MDDNELSRALGETPSEYKLEDVDPIFKDLGSTPPPQPSSYSSGQSDPIVGGTLGGVGALIGGYARQKINDKDLEEKIIKRIKYENEISAIKEAAAKGQTASERGLQGRTEDLSGTSGRARQTMYNTETSRLAQSEKGASTPFTKQPWGATNSGILVDPKVADISRMEQLKALNSAQRMELIKHYAAIPAKTAGEILAKSRILGILGGAIAGTEGYEAYKSGVDRGDYSGALEHGLQALGGAIGMIPSWPTAIGGAIVSALPTIYNKVKNIPVDPRYQAPVSQQDIEGASAAYYGRSPRNRMARSGLEPLS